MDIFCHVLLLWCTKEVEDANGKLVKMSAYVCLELSVSVAQTIAHRIFK